MCHSIASSAVDDENTRSFANAMVAQLGSVRCSREVCSELGKDIGGHVSQDGTQMVLDVFLNTLRAECECPISCTVNLIFIFYFSYFGTLSPLCSFLGCPILCDIDRVICKRCPQQPHLLFWDCLHVSRLRTQSLTLGFLRKIVTGLVSFIHKMRSSQLPLKNASYIICPMHGIATILHFLALELVTDSSAHAS